MVKELQPNTGRPYTCTYERGAVEGLLTALWNDGVLVNEEAPDEGMPRSKANPARLGGVLVGMIDVGRAVRELDVLTYMLLRLHYGDGMPVSKAGPVLGVSRGVAQRKIDAGVSAVLTFLNGAEESDE